MTDTQGLNLQDIILVLRIIDAAAQRGAIRADEMSVVGACRDKIAAFVEAATPKTDENPVAESNE